MRFSEKFASATLSLPSPDGRWIATLLPSGIHIRAIDRLEAVASVIALPPDLPAAAVHGLHWSASSARLLAATSDQVFVTQVVHASATNTNSDADGAGQEAPFQAVIRNPSLPVVAKPVYLGFGPMDDQVCMCSAHGLKFSVFNLQTGQVVEIANPKLFSSARVCTRGFSHRPGSGHLAVLTRTAGKDSISVHSPLSMAVFASWAPDTADAQGLVWSPDGRWLVVWESPAYGHKALFYTPDGYLFKVWTGKPPEAVRSVHTAGDLEGGEPCMAAEESLGPGIRLAQFSADSRILAISDTSRCVRTIDVVAGTEGRRLVHPTTLRPHAHPLLKLWQEQLDLAATGMPSSSSHSFVEATQSISPPGRPPTNYEDATASSGCSILTFDASSSLLATRIDEAPSTVWVWHMETGLLRAVLMLHAAVSAAVWHPERPQTLLISCDGEKHRGLGVLWNPEYATPLVADFAPYHPPSSSDGHQSAGRHSPTWLKLSGVPPSVFYSDGAYFSVAAVDDDGRDKNASAIPWKQAPLPQSRGPAAQRWGLGGRAHGNVATKFASNGANSDGDSEVDDTFHYKNGE